MLRPFEKITFFVQDPIKEIYQPGYVYLLLSTILCFCAMIFFSFHSLSTIFLSSTHFATSPSVNNPQLYSSLFLSLCALQTNLSLSHFSVSNVLTFCFLLTRLDWSFYSVVYSILPLLHDTNGSDRAYPM